MRRTIPALVKEWGPALVMGAAIGAAIATGGGWVYRVDEHIRWGQQRSQKLDEVDARTSRTEAATWALLYWARQVSKKEGWPEPPTVLGMEKPAEVKVVPPYRPGMYAAEREDPGPTP